MHRIALQSRYGLILRKREAVLPHKSIHLSQQTHPMLPLPTVDPNAEAVENVLRSDHPERALPLLFKLYQEQNTRIVQLERTVALQAEKIAVLELREKQRFPTSPEDSMKTLERLRQLPASNSMKEKTPDGHRSPPRDKSNESNKSQSREGGIKPLSMDPKISMKVCAGLRWAVVCAAPC